MTGVFRPVVLLLVLVLLGVGAALAGVWLGREQREVVGERDVEGDRRFAEAAQRELDRLEHLYESRLRLLGGTLTPGDEFDTRLRAKAVAGVAQVGVFRTRGRSELVDANGRSPWLRPVVEAADVVDGETVAVELPVGGLEESAWTDVAGGGLYFVLRRDDVDAWVVFVVDRAAVGGALDRWVKEVWLAEAAVRPAGGDGRWELASAAGGVLAGGGDGERRAEPDFVQGLHTRFGTWRVASWVPRSTETGYHVPTVAWGVGGGVLCVLLGTGVFLQQRRVLREADRRVSFANRVSHELRTPVTNMLLNLDLVADGMGEAPEAVGRRLGLVREEGGRLGRLIENALAYSGRREPRRGRCAPDAVVRDVVAGFAPSMERRGISVELSGAFGAEVELDGDGLAQVVANLLSNVEKYAGEGARATVSVERQDDGGLAVEVADDGPGIPEGARERVFEPFERLSDRIDEGVTGAGLGLSISRDLAVEMGGSLEIVAGERGAQFRLSVPCATEEAAP